MDYPYTAENVKCLEPSFNQKWATCTSNKISYSSTGLSNEVMKTAINTYGAMAGAVRASSYYFQFVASGIARSANCNTGSGGIDHAVTFVGWGTENGIDYWIMANSWGRSWGNNGFGRMEMDSGKGGCLSQLLLIYPTGCTLL